MSTYSCSLSIVIVSWNCRSVLQVCLRSVIENPPQVTYEIIVVDNDSHDGSADLVAEEFPGVRLIRNDRNVGFGAACNKGVSIATGELLLFLNPDTEVLEQTLQGVISYLKSHPDVGVVGCRLLESDRSVQPSCGNFPTFFSSLYSEIASFLVLMRCENAARSFLRTVNLSPSPSLPNLRRLFDGESTSDVDWVIGAFLMLQRKAIRGTESVFDERFAIYCEDLDLCQRVRNFGFRVVYLPKFSVVHIGGVSASGDPRRRDAARAVARIFLHRKHGGNLSALACQVKLFVKELKSICSIVLKLILSGHGFKGSLIRDRVFVLKAILRPSFDGALKQSTKTKD